jgi:branched-subunit amino acid transport protein
MSEYVLIILGMGIVTYLPRFLPLYLFTRRRLPAWLEEGLALLPPAILGALVFPLILFSGESGGWQLWSPQLAAALITALLILHTRSLAVGVVAGMLSFWLGQQFF